MKKHLLIFLFATAPLIGLSQILSQPLMPPCLGDSTELELSGANGDTINWEMSLNNNNWFPVAGTDSFFTTPPLNTPTYYRAGVTTMGVTNYSNSTFIEFHSGPQLFFSNYTGTSIWLDLSGNPSNTYYLSWSGAGNGSTLVTGTSYIMSGLMPGLPLTVICVGDFLGVTCTSLYTFSPCSFSLSEIHSNATCGNNDGAIDLTVMPSTSATYIWSNGETTEDLNNLSSGIYNVTVTDTSGCFLYQTVTVINSNGPSVNETHLSSTCFLPNGGIDITTTNGVPPYSYLWSNADTTEDINGLSAGTYSVTVSDINNCEGFSSVLIYDSAFYYYVYLSATSPNCVNNGTIDAQVSGGHPPFSYLWSNGQTSQIINLLAQGFYSVTVTDNTGCISTASNFQLLSSCDNILQGRIFEDANSNCIFDSGESPIWNMDVIASNGNVTYYATTDDSGFYFINIGFPGTFSVSPSFGFYGGASCGNYTACNGNPVIFPAMGDTSFGNDFGFGPTSFFDLQIFPYCFSANPGFEKEYVVSSWDNSYYSPYTGTAIIAFNYDPNLTYDSSYAPLPVNDSINHTLTWQIPNFNLNSFQDLHCFFHVPASLPLTYLLQSDFSISPIANDCDTSNNHLHITEVVTGSNDPNEKTVTPSGNITGSDSVLNYTIHFQNTGTDSTHFVFVKDTLSQYLNPATVVNLASSAPYSDFNISGTGILTWIFNPLFLPDSASNNAASKGFVMFKVKVKPNLAGGTEINNKASIYFDYNPPVVTNTASNTLVTGIKEINEASDVTVYPNPTSDAITVTSDKIINTISITDILGREVFKKQTNQKSVICNLQSLSRGIYFLKVTDANGIALVKKIVKE